MRTNLILLSIVSSVLFTQCTTSPGESARSGSEELQGVLRIATALTFSETNVQAGDTVTGTVTYTNPGSGSVTIQAIAIAARPPGGTHTGGPFDDFSPYAGPLTLAPGQSVTVTATRTFSASDPAGGWDVYSTYQDASGTWFDGPDETLLVGGGGVQDGALEITSALSLGASSVAFGDTVTGSVTLTNDGVVPVDVQNVVIAARPPGGTHAGGPFDDFSPTAPAQTLAPGASLTLQASRTFSSSDPTGAWDLYPTWEDGSGTWHDGTDSSLDVVGATTGGGGGSGGNGRFSIAHGQIIGPNGQPFYGRGVNVYDSQMSSVSTGSNGAPLTEVLPGINIVRLNVFSYADPSYYQAFIDQLTGLGIVVELEDHTNDAGNAGGGAGSVFSGAQLTAELDWYASVASAFAGNPYVWFGTDNEPSENPSAAALSTWQQQTYEAIRGAGNDSIVLVEMNCGNTPSSCGAGYTASAYAGMTNIVWDVHYYGWLTNDSTDVGVIAQSLSGNAQAAQAFTSADGIVPVIIGEYGISTDGQNTDPNGTQVVSVVEQSGYGCMAWGWNPGANDDVTDGSNNLTPYGQQVAQFIAQ
jgi:hypothetical protein